jgi:hypothetical protein
VTKKQRTKVQQRVTKMSNVIKFKTAKQIARVAEKAQSLARKNTREAKLMLFCNTFDFSDTFDDVIDSSQFRKTQRLSYDDI